MGIKTCVHSFLFSDLCVYCFLIFSITIQTFLSHLGMLTRVIGAYAFSVDELMLLSVSFI